MLMRKEHLSRFIPCASNLNWQKTPHGERGNVQPDHEVGLARQKWSCRSKQSNSHAIMLGPYMIMQHWTHYSIINRSQTLMEWDYKWFKDLAYFCSVYFFPPLMQDLVSSWYLIHRALPTAILDLLPNGPIFTIYSEKMRQHIKTNSLNSIAYIGHIRIWCLLWNADIGINWWKGACS